MKKKKKKIFETNLDRSRKSMMKHLDFGVEAIFLTLDAENQDPHLNLSVSVQSKIILKVVHTDVLGFRRRNKHPNLFPHVLKAGNRSIRLIRMNSLKPTQAKRFRFK